MALFVCEKWVARGQCTAAKRGKSAVGGRLAAGRSDARDTPGIRCVMKGKVCSVKEIVS